ncbi:vesicle transport protein USE1-like [Punica granatum]|uniref:Vesicle transport protein USE1-like n=1 Tax=Punica granatum TaxID=22663 RepID=A0A6P8C8A8_PUNGR|nr:vesicle transport protein USE1-like [Punica granatum]
MGISKTEVNLRRLLAAAPKQQNQAKLAHYVATLREQLEQLAEERTPEGLPRIAKVTINDYSEKIEAIAAKLVAPSQDIEESHESFAASSSQGSSPKGVENHIPPSPGLRRRAMPSSHSDERTRKDTVEDPSGPVRLDATTQAHIEKHRNLQEDLTDEMVGLARQLKESSLLMNQSIENTEKILDSTERAVEHSLASTGRVNVRAGEIYSRSSKTSCFQWLLIFVMTMIFIMVVLLIRVT